MTHNMSGSVSLDLGLLQIRMQHFHMDKVLHFYFKGDQRHYYTSRNFIVVIALIHPPNMTLKNFDLEKFH